MYKLGINYLLLEKYHVSTTFLKLSEDIYNILYPYISIGSEKWIRLNMGKSKFVGYDYDIETKSVSKKDKNLCKLPIYIKIWSDTNALFALSYKTDKFIMISANIPMLSDIFTHLSESEFKAEICSSIQHEFVHVIQLQHDYNFNDILTNIACNDKFIDKAIELIRPEYETPEINGNIETPLLLNYRDALKSLCRMLTKYELEANITAIHTKLCSYNKETIFNKLCDIAKEYNDNNFKTLKYNITLDTIKYCLRLVSNESKLDIIINSFKLIKKDETIYEIFKYLIKKLPIPKYDIDTYIKEYEIKVMKLIYYTLHNDVKYDEGIDKSELTMCKNLSEALNVNLFDRIIREIK